MLLDDAFDGLDVHVQHFAKVLVGERERDLIDSGGDHVGREQEELLLAIGVLAQLHGGAIRQAKVTDLSLEHLLELRARTYGKDKATGNWRDSKN